MDQKLYVNYKVEDFVADETFLNYHFNSNKNDHLFWEDWLLHHPEKEELANEAIKIIETLSLSVSEEEFRNEFIKLKKAINDPSNSDGLKLKKFPVARFTKKRKIEFAVVLLMVVFSGWFWLVKVSGIKTENLTEIANNTAFPKVITLSDSSVVTLAPYSYIQYPSTFKEKVRNVYLHGNAGFTVKRDVKHPFKVHAENIVATVLGTVFNIKKSGDSAIVVELLKGKLNVEIVNAQMESQQSVLLSPNERAVYVRNDKHLYKNLIVPDHYLNFKQNNFDEIAAKIKSVYGITLINKSSKTDWSFTGEFKNRDVKEIIENMCLVKNLYFSMQGDTILIK
jgi:ferric-dicitrate binding protein FerR (iron transport regulator)